MTIRDVGSHVGFFVRNEAVIRVGGRSPQMQTCSSPARASDGRGGGLRPDLLRLGQAVRAGKTSRSAARN